MPLLRLQLGEVVELGSEEKMFLDSTPAPQEVLPIICGHMYNVS